MGIFNVAVTGLNAAQVGILTTSHNIANASTEGYNRQQIIQSTNTPMFTGAGYIGQGTNVLTVRRVYDQQLSEQVLAASTGAAEMDSYLTQISQIKKMGNLKDLASMIPGVGKAIRDLDFDDDAFKSIEAIIHSMTPAERENPMVINGSRRKRISSGSGTTIQDVNRLIKQFDETRKLMKMMTGGGAQKMARALKSAPRR